jgi:excisionase family DNA binding protein
MAREKTRSVTREPFLLDIPEVAQRMNTTVFAVRQLLRAGEIPYLVIGHRWLVSPQALRQFIRRREEAFHEHH